jgi:ADP-ribosylation factor related protein 1
LLLAANKQDHENALDVHDIRSNYESWFQAKREAAVQHRPGEEHEIEQRRERIASLDVMGVSALDGQVNIKIS